MSWLRALLPTIGYRVQAVLYLVLGPLACFVPLLNVVGYESAALFGVVGGIYATFVRDPGLLDRAKSPGFRFLKAWGRQVLLLGVGLLILGLNVLRVQNCDPVLGVMFWVAIPLVSVGIGVLTRLFVSEIFHGWKAEVAALVTILSSIGYFAWRLATQPPIIGFQLHLGYFSGSIYDEALALPESLVFYRLVLSAGALTLLLALEFRFRWKTYDRAAGIGALALVLAGITALGVSRFEENGIDIGADYVAEQLAGRVESEHFIIHYSTRGNFDVERLVEDHEFRYHEMKEYFGTDPIAHHGEKLRSFVYASPQEKGVLMGGRRTLVARLWLGEMHIVWRRFGESLLAHELSHMFTAPFGAGPLDLSARYWVGVNMGLVEGISVAADWPPAEFSPHEATAILRRLNIAPDIRKIVGATGFWGQSSSRSYTVTGSFIRYLVDKYGMEKLQRAYARGEWEFAYGRPLDELALEWEAFLDGQVVDESTMDVARFVYDRPSIFQKVCARSLAELRLEVERAMASGQEDRAKEIYGQILGFDPQNVYYHLEYVRFLAGLGLDQQALEAASEAATLAKTPTEKAQIEEIRGDLYWRAGKSGDSLESYEECLSFGLPIERKRTVWVKRDWVSGEPHASRLAQEYLVDSQGHDNWLALLELARLNPSDPMANYLVARRHMHAGRYRDAKESLELSDGVKTPLVEVERDFMGAQIHYHLRDWPAALGYVERLKESEYSMYRMYAEEWERRIEWQRKRLEGIDNEFD